MGYLLIEVEQRAQSPDVGVERLDGVFAVEHRRGDGSHVDDEIRLVCSVDVGDMIFDDVKFLDVEQRVLLQFLNPFGIAQHEIVQCDHLLHPQGLSLGVEEVHEIIPQKSSAPGDEDSGILKPRLLFCRKTVQRVLKISL
jgi:hypothetical protein